MAPLYANPAYGSILIVLIALASNGFSTLGGPSALAFDRSSITIATSRRTWVSKRVTKQM